MAVLPTSPQACWGEGLRPLSLHFCHPPRHTGAKNAWQSNAVFSKMHRLLSTTVSMYWSTLWQFRHILSLPFTPRSKRLLMQMVVVKLCTVLKIENREQYYGREPQVYPWAPKLPAQAAQEYTSPIPGIFLTGKFLKALTPDNKL